VCDQNTVRRLFSTFARGWPGGGLLLLRLVAAAALLCQAILPLATGHSLSSVLFAVFAIGLGVLLLLGLWTPIAGILTALFELRNVASRCDNLWLCIFLGALGVALAMIGPGAWSIDARLFGWKRIDPQRR
jgi:putative oxidoreductase